MNEFLSLEEVRKTFVERRSLMDEKKIDEVLGFSSRRDKILSLFSIRYKPMKKLINDGILIYSFVYKISYLFNGNSNYKKCWVLFSPNLKYEENPSEYSKIAAKLEYFLNSKDKKHKKIIKKLNNSENDFKLLELPFDIFEEKLFLSTIYVKEKVNPNLDLGINLCLLNRKVSKNIIFLPEVFYSHQPQS